MFTQLKSVQIHQFFSDWRAPMHVADSSELVDAHGVFKLASGSIVCLIALSVFCPRMSYKFC